MWHLSLTKSHTPMNLLCFSIKNYSNNVWVNFSHIDCDKPTRQRIVNHVNTNSKLISHFIMNLIL